MSKKTSVLTLLEEIFSQTLMFTPYLVCVALFIFAFFNPFLFGGFFQVFGLLSYLYLPWPIVTLLLHPTVFYIAKEKPIESIHAAYMFVISLHMIAILETLTVASAYFSPMLWLFFITQTWTGLYSPVFHCYNHLLLIIGFCLFQHTPFVLLFPFVSTIATTITLVHLQQTDDEINDWEKIAAFCGLSFAGSLLSIFADPIAYALTGSICCLLLYSIHKHYPNKPILGLCLAHAPYITLLFFPHLSRYLFVMPSIKMGVSAAAATHQGLDSLQPIVDSTNTDSYNIKEGEDNELKNTNQN